MLLSGPVFFVSSIGFGTFEANAIQFGMDQMIESSSEQLSSFIHLYFWCVYIGPLVMYYLICGIIYYINRCILELGHIHEDFPYIVGWICLLSSCIQLPISFLGLVLVICYERLFHIEQTSRNTLMMIYNVLKYSYHHKYPERRSAFTYWENDIPSRIDLGKKNMEVPLLMNK